MASKHHAGDNSSRVTKYIPDENTYHCILIKDLSPLLSSQCKGDNRRLFFVSVVCMVAILMQY